MSDNFLTRLFATKTPVVEKPDEFVGETARRVDDLYRFWQPQIYNPDELSAKKGGLGLYKKMRQDDQVKACLSLKKSAIVSAGWTLDGDNKTHTDWIRYNFDSVEGSFQATMYAILSAFDYGFSVTEKVYQYVDRGKYEGFLGLKALKPKSPTRITFDLDQFGNLKPDGIWQRLDDGTINKLEVDRFVLYSYQKEFDNYYGDSDLRAAYRPWFVKQEVMKYWAIYLERFSIPITTGKINSGKVTETQKIAFRELISRIQAGMSAILPPDIEIQFNEASRTDRGAFQAAIDALNVAIARSLLIPQLVGLVSQEGVGSYAQSKTHLDTFDFILAMPSSELEEVVNEQLIRQLIDVNYGPQVAYPTFRLSPMKMRDKMSFVTAWADAIQKGASSATVSSEQQVRRLLGFPPLTDEEEKDVEDRLEKEANAPPPIPFGGPRPVGQTPLSTKTGEPHPRAAAEKRNVMEYVPGAERRIDFSAYVASLDKVEEEHKKLLTNSFEESIMALITDAKKNSTFRSA